MRVFAVNNNYNQPNFNAKFSKSDINHFLSDIKDHDASLVPKLYTLLDFVDKLPGEKAKIVKPLAYADWFKIHIDGKSATGDHEFINAFTALYTMVVKHKDSILKESDIVRMPERIFEQEWWKNRFVTVANIKEFSENS